ncbi:ABC transporter permease [candidate division CSSED10-310 bacterium]|uniref:ABC transporter permease n=1 Tax=candidate division CSSED10-310 bacterium TaxID=2855610 RepID=A0ABV6YZQ2_UNCC1
MNTSISQFLKQSKIILSALIIFLFIFWALAAAYIAPFSPHYVFTDSASDLEHAFAGPSLLHPFGKDDLGRDMVSRMIWGSRISLFVGFTVVSISVLLGLSIGLVAGYYRGWIDEILMRVIDMALAFPGILLAIAIIAVLGPGIVQTVIALCITGWVSYARLTRGLVLAEWGKTYVQASIALGARPGRMMYKHILPNILAPLIIKSTFGLAGAILAEASLSFLGLGVQPPTPSWGNMLNLGAQYLVLPEAWHMTIFPGFAIMILVMAIYIIGEGARDWLDPHMSTKIE